MPINFGNYVFRPPSLAQGGFAEGLSDIIQGNRFRQQQAQQESQYARTRSDTQATNSAEFAKGQSNAAYDKEKARYDNQVVAINKARAAGQAGHWEVARALLPGILQLGGQAEEQPDGKYLFKEGDAPTRGAPDIAGARSQIYGPSGPNASAPFSVPGFGANGQRNPMDPHALPGAAAASMPQSAPAPGSPAPLGAPPAGAAPAAGPPPGKATEGYPGREGMVPPDGALPPPMEQPASAPPGAQPEQASSPQPSGPNPFTPSALDPYTIDPKRVMAENQERLKPWLQGVQKGIPQEYQYRLNGLNDAVSSLGYTPEDSLKLYQPTFNTLTGLMKADINRESARASMGLRGTAMENTRNDRLMRNAQARTEVIGKKYQLTENIKRWQDIDDVKGLLGMHSGQADTQAISAIRNMYQSGVMTDEDFKNVKSGATRTIWQKIKDGTIETFISNGVSPDTRAALLDLVNFAKGRSSSKIQTAQTQMLQTVRNPRTSSAEERDYYLNSAAQSVPEELWDPMVREAMGIPLDQKSGPMDQSGNYAVRRAPPASGESLGTSSLPSTLDGKGGSVSANASVSKSKSGKAKTVAEKSNDELTQEDINGMSTEELERRLAPPEGAP